MDELDKAYKAFKEYRDQTAKVTEIGNFLNDAHTKSNTLESLECFTSICIVENDWVDKIQEILPFVGNAVYEERQFVRSDGDVLPIEKIRSVGKDSIYDLAKHSNYITREPEEGKPITPDKLMMPIKENDYAVYENRFLYSLLIYLSQFIEIRLNEILAITGKYEAKTHIIKKHKTSSRIYDYEITFNDTRFNDNSHSTSDSESAKSIERIKYILNDAKLLLMTPLMKEVSKAPMVKPPIVKTNVFKFDHNFKRSLELYTFLQNYNKKGFRIENVVTKMSPYQLKMSNAFSELTYLTSFLTYMYGNKLEPDLKVRYEIEEKKRKEQEDRKYLAELKRIEKNVKESGMTPEEYIFMLQKGNKILERTVVAKDQEIADTKKKVDDKIASLNAEIDKRVDSVRKSIDEEYKEQYQKSFDEMKAKEVALEQSFKSKEELMNANAKKKQEELSKLIEDSKAQLNDKMKEMNEAILKNNTEKNEAIKACNDKVSDLESQQAELNKQHETQLKELTDINLDVTNENQLLKARVDSFHFISGFDYHDDHLGEEGMAELEIEKVAFDEYYNKVWNNNKKILKKQIYGVEKYQEYKKDKKVRKLLLKDID